MTVWRRRYRREDGIGEWGTCCAVAQQAPFEGAEFQGGWVCWWRTVRGRSAISVSALAVTRPGVGGGSPGGEAQQRPELGGRIVIAVDDNDPVG